MCRVMWCCGSLLVEPDFVLGRQGNKERSWKEIKWRGEKKEHREQVGA